MRAAFGKAEAEAAERRVLSQQASKKNDRMIEEKQKWKTQEKEKEEDEEDEEERVGAMKEKRSRKKRRRKTAWMKEH